MKELYLNRILPIFLLLVLLAIGGFFRFNHITSIGISRGDGFSYLGQAKKWPIGDYELKGKKGISEKFYRPVVFILQGAAVDILGYNDYSIKILNATLDTLSILLIFYIAFLIIRNRWFALSISLVYAFLPRIISLARSEMVHAETTFLVLLSILFLLLWHKNNQLPKLSLVYVTISGIFCSLGAQTHLDIAFLAPGIVIYILLSDFNTNNIKKSLLKGFIPCGVFSLTFFLTYGFIAFVLGFSDSIAVFLNSLSKNTSDLISVYGHSPKSLLFINIFRFSLEFFFGGFSHEFMALFTVSFITIFLLYFLSVNREYKINYFLSAILLFSYVLQYGIFLNTFPKHYGRVAMPLLPFFIIHTFTWIYFAVKSIFKRNDIFVYSAVSLVIFLFLPKVNYSKLSEPSIYRHVYDAINSKTNEKNHLLITPVTIYSMDHGFKFNLYFQNKAYYLGFLTPPKEYNIKSLYHIVDKKHIKFIFMADKKRIDKRLLNPNYINSGVPQQSQAFTNLVGWLSSTNIEYSVDKDYEIIQNFIDSHGGVLIDSSNWRKLYELYDKNTILQTNFEYWDNGMPSGNWYIYKGKAKKAYVDNSTCLSLIIDKKVSNQNTRVILPIKKLIHTTGKNVLVKIKYKSKNEDKFSFYMTAGKEGQRKAIPPGRVQLKGDGGWNTSITQFKINEHMVRILFNLELRKGSSGPVYIDELQILYGKNDEFNVQRHTSEREIVLNQTVTDTGTSLALRESNFSRVHQLQHQNFFLKAN